MALPQIQAEFLGVLNQPIRHLDDVASWNAQTYSFRQPRRHQLICENSYVLRIVLKLDDIRMTVGCQHEMALCPATHPSNRLCSQNCQTASASIGLYLLPSLGRSSPPHLFSRTERHRHRHHAIIMRSGVGADFPTTMPHKTSALL